jgi:hypothetical protein
MCTGHASHDFPDASPLSAPARRLRLRRNDRRFLGEISCTDQSVQNAIDFVIGGPPGGADAGRASGGVAHAPASVALKDLQPVRGAPWHAALGYRATATRYAVAERRSEANRTGDASKRWILLSVKTSRHFATPWKRLMGSHVSR